MVKVSDCHGLATGLWNVFSVKGVKIRIDGDLQIWKIANPASTLIIIGESKVCLHMMYEDNNSPLSWLVSVIIDLQAKSIIYVLGKNVLNGALMELGIEFKE